MSFRAVHIEITHSIETDSFKLALTRLIARRRNVQTIFPDNGSNFIGSENKLRRALEEMDKKKIHFFMQASGGDWVSWKRNPPPPLMPAILMVFGSVRSVQFAPSFLLRCKHMVDHLMRNHLQN